MFGSFALAAAAAPAEPVLKRPLAGATIVLDPGHNGGNAAHPERVNRPVSIGRGQKKACDTTGTQTASGYAEWRFNMALAKRTKRVLVRRGAKVVMTRRDNHGVGPCVDRRAKIGNRANADAAVSIHADGGPASGRGFHVIYPTKIRGLTDDIFVASRSLARAIRGHFQRKSGVPVSNYVGSRGLDRRGDLGGLRLSDVPKVFIEVGNMRNSRDVGLLMDARPRKRMAVALVDGLRRFLGSG